MFSMCFCVGSICVLRLPPPQSNEMRARLIGVSELTVGVNVSVSMCVSPVTDMGCTLPFTV